MSSRNFEKREKNLTTESTEGTERREGGQRVPEGLSANCADFGQRFSAGKGNLTTEGTENTDRIKREGLFVSLFSVLSVVNPLSVHDKVHEFVAGFPAIGSNLRNLRNPSAIALAAADLRIRNPERRIDDEDEDDDEDD